ncbi:MAG: hypothetical protein ACKO91_06565 [Acidimicrobiales bacterium]
MRLTRDGRVASLVLGSGLLLAPLAVACGDDSSSSAAASTTSAYAIVADAKVTSGFAAFQAAAAAVAAGPKDAVDKNMDAVEKAWSSFEGTVKKNEKDIYLSLEDQMAALKKAAKADDGNAEQAALKAIADLAQQYLAKHPG